LNILARGIPTRLDTRACFAGEQPNAGDKRLPLLADETRRARLLAQPTGPRAWRLDIRLHGPGESVFIDVQQRLADAPGRRIRPATFCQSGNDRLKF
jgi:protocatechuate 3,4-dioxygenase alpha subunit